ncbi:MAG: response regulator [Myxococcota bacterium]
MPSILIVDDEELLRSMLVLNFENQGFKIFQADNGKTGLELLQQHPEIDLVLSDIRMPLMDGIGMIQAYKKINNEVPIFMMMTGYSDLSPEEIYDFGANALFQKPFNRGQINEAVKAALAPKAMLWTQKPEYKEKTVLQELNLKDMASLSLGRGGLFVPTKERFPQVETPVNTNIHFENGESMELTGLVRWVRKTATSQYPSGYGLEITYADPESKARLLPQIQSSKYIPFIPKC